MRVGEHFVVANQIKIKAFSHYQTRRKALNLTFIHLANSLLLDLNRKNSWARRK